MSDDLHLMNPQALRGYAHPLRMSLLGLLRRAGPLTATQAAAELGESVPNCSFHLRQMAKYGMVERVPGADGRERPWQATAQTTSWDDTSDEPGMRAAIDELSTVLLDQYLRRAEQYLRNADDETPQWRDVTGLADTFLHVTPAELGELTREIHALLARYDERRTDPTARPIGARAVQFIQMLLPIPVTPAKEDGKQRHG